MPSLKTRIAALERPHGGHCLVCSLGHLGGSDASSCNHPPGLTLVDILKSLPLKQQPGYRHAKP